MILIDTHTHLYLKEFKTDIQEVIDKALAADVKYFIIPNINSTSVAPMLQLCSRYPEVCFPSIGLHPGSVNLDYKNEITIVENWLKKEKFVAIGEIGIDLYWNKTYFNEQVDAFKLQLLLAKKYDLPVIIHSRNSMNEIIGIMKDDKYQGIKGIFHCFPGNMEQALHIIQKGFKLGIGGVVTYKNSGLAKIVKDIPLKHIVLETDSPYLPPVPYRGQRNESVYILHIANFIAKLKECALEEVASVTTANATGIFNLPF
ncbi:MAG: TatD family hydrolase [Bacteroidales bacterium]